MDADYSLRSTGPSKKRQRHSNRTPKPKKNFEYEESEPEDEEYFSDEEVSGAPRRSLRRKRTNKSTDDHHEDLSSGGRKKRMSAKAFRESKYLCGLLIANILKHKNAWPFAVPVDPVALNLPDYNDRIKNPMDLGTVKKKLEVGSYIDSDDFASDIKLVFDNCRSYNDLESDIVRMGNELEAAFNEQFVEVKQREAKIVDNYEIAEMKQIIQDLQAEHQKLLAELNRLLKGPNSPDDKPPPLISHPKKVKSKRGRKPKPVAPPEPKKPVEYDYNMKELLSQKISSLSADNLQKMVQYLSTTPEISTTESQAEFELDLEKMSNATLSNLDDFVNRRLTEQTGGSQVLSANTNGSAIKDDDSDSSSSSSESEPDDIQDV